MSHDHAPAPVALRQICLIAHALADVQDDLEAVLGLSVCFRDPGVARFGLENMLMPVGSQFLEVVAPVREDAPANRFLQRSGPGGYMVICQTTDRRVQAACRERALSQSIRVAFEYETPDYSLMQLHPADMGASFLEIDWDSGMDIEGHWEPADGLGWKPFVRPQAPVRIAEVHLQSTDPGTLARRWADVMGTQIAEPAPNLFVVSLANARLVFSPVIEAGGQAGGESLCGLVLDAPDAAARLEAARARSLPVDGDTITLAGIGIALREDRSARP